MKLLYQVLRPPGNSPDAKTIHLADSPGIIRLGGVARQPRIVCKVLKDSQWLVPIALGRGKKNVENGVIHRVAVLPTHRP